MYFNTRVTSRNTGLCSVCRDEINNAGQTAYPG